MRRASARPDGVQALRGGGAALRRNVQRAGDPSATASGGRRWPGRPSSRPRRETSRAASCRAPGTARDRGSTERTSRSPACSCLPAATRTASWPAPLIWKKALDLVLELNLLVVDFARQEHECDRRRAGRPWSVPRDPRRAFAAEARASAPLARVDPFIAAPIMALSA